MTVIVDLHTHTNASDGTLSPNELVQRAFEAGVEILSITDHDTVAAYRDLNPTTGNGPHLVAGVEFSTQWRTTGVHVLGLNVDLTSGAIETATSFQSNARIVRAERIAERLERVGVHDTLAGALAFAGGGAVGRPHFARFLVASGIVKDAGHAFRKYLGAGKAGDVRQHWATLEQIIEWIRASGGTAVLAHPGKYGLTRTKRVRLIEEFQSLGGMGIEVISGRQDPMLVQSLADTALSKGLLASAGSDFHQPDQPWARLGMPLQLPTHCRPVWDTW